MSLLQKEHLMPFNPKSTQKAKRLRSNMTNQEKKLWYDFLAKKQPRFTRQKPIDQYIVDFYCSKARLIVEVDGSQHYTEEGVKYDAMRTATLEAYQLKVVRFTNHDIDVRFDGVCQQIDTIVEGRG